MYTTKAFDRLDFPLLFEKLRTQDTCPVMLGLLLYNYVCTPENNSEME